MNVRLSAKNLYFALVGLSVLALGALLASAYGANVILKHKAQDIREARLENLVLEQEQLRLAKAKADIARYSSLAEIAKHIVPQDKDQAQTVREIVSIASQHNITLGSITFPSSTLGGKDGQNSQLQKVKDIPDVLSLDITVQSDSKKLATYGDFLAFLDALEHNRRTALVKSISLQPDTTDPSLLSFSLTLREYIKP